MAHEGSSERRPEIERRTTRSLIDDSVQLCAQFFNETGGKSTMTKEQFMRATGCKSDIFGCKLFETLDSDKSGYVTVDDFLEGLTKLRASDAMERIRFVFSIFDLDGDGTITKEELKTVICASVEESDNQMTEEETAQFVSTLLQVFDSDGSDNISLEGFANVLRNYPDLLTGLTFGTFGTLTSASAKDSQSQQKKSFRRVRKMTSWVINNPQRLFTYTTVSLVLIGCFLWRFLRYSGNCDGVDMDYRDPLTGYSRSHLKDELNNRTIAFLDEDFNYMVFSKVMSEQDPIQCRDARKRKLFSWTLPIAKGCGQAMKATFTLILFPVSRNLMTTLRETFLKHIFPFDRAIEFHKFLGRVGFWLAWTHVVCHIVDIKNWTDPDRFNCWSWAFPDDRTADEVQGCRRFPSGEPEYDDSGRMISDGSTSDGIPRLLLNVEHQPTLRDILSSAVAITGIILIVVYSIAALFAFDYPKKLKIFRKTEAEKRGEISQFRRLILALGRVLNDFNYFWYSHHLFGVFYIALLFHPLPDLPDERNEWAVSDSWLWVGIPALIYLIERALRVKRSSGRTRVVGADILPGGVVGLKVRRPRWFNYTPGQYVFIKCPQISRFEWHPFTLTSCPGDSYLGVHVRKAGDWTSALHSMVVDYHTNREMNMLREVEPSGVLQNPSTYIVKPVVGEELEVAERFPFNILVDGPFGAPAQDYADYQVIVLIGAGIGVTPFASVLTDLLDSLHKCACPRCGYSNPEQMCTQIKKVYFYWTVRSRSEASWFKHLLEAIALRDDEEGLLDININITGIKGANDLRTMMLSLAQYECAEEAGSDFHSRAVTRFGRANWNRVFERVKAEFPQESNVGVFYCGPTTIAQSLDKLCRVHSRGPTKFSFMKESFG